MTSIPEEGHIWQIFDASLDVCLCDKAIFIDIEHIGILSKLFQGSFLFDFLLDELGEELRWNTDDSRRSDRVLRTRGGQSLEQGASTDIVLLEEVGEAADQ